MVGGGTAAMRPGEVSCAHGGVLFLDELAEFAATVLDGLREPLEEGVVRVTRARATVDFPARFLLVAAMNPCPCGVGGSGAACTCGRGRARYLRRISGPLLDRFDLRLQVERPAVGELLGATAGESTAVARERVLAAHARASERGVGRNAAITTDRLDELAPLTASAVALLRRELELGRLTGRGLHRIRRVALTLADLNNWALPLDDTAIATALSLRIDPAAWAREAVA
jgi:magnesium chelatase family protein